ncbi:MAG: methenyltetrahydromethanopterin cyclohydrolase [Anaerolineaceae bacterium]|nr:methenyltetrahydromethanopterin cyclohydrolase [Anaerolineaceae bacterium]
MRAMNDVAWNLVQNACVNEEELGIETRRLNCGSLILDMGVQAEGGLAAGLAMAEIGMAGLGSARLDLGEFGNRPWLWVTTQADKAMQACFLSQAAHWSVKVDSYSAMGSGPACVINSSLELNKKYGYAEQARYAVLVLEARGLPDEAICQKLASDCKVNAARLAVVVAPTASLAGSVQIAARSVETALHKLERLRFDIRKVVSGVGKAPLAPSGSDDFTAMGMTNDLIIFGSQVWLAVRGASDAELTELVKKIPASTSPSYGEPFCKLLETAGGFYNIDPGLFAPAEVVLTSLETGRVFHAGAADEAKILELFNQ